MWNETLIEGLTGPQVVNDSKTPSGRVHVGSLRGVLIHDAIYRALISHGLEARYSYGIDDFDPLDGLPADAEPWMQGYMGHPLCNIPALQGSASSDLAQHYISEFLDVLAELGVGADVYRMRDIYRSGQFNEAIDVILTNAHLVRKIYAEVSNAQRPDDWLPFQVICESCGKIGSTEVTHYNGKEVTYECKPGLVKWATGCGYRGEVSPFDGKGKLPWKLEWVAKWHTFGITIEGAGKDHCTKGGSREVAAACLWAIFGRQPPLNVPYEFFLVGGAKMSSSRGVGTSAREMAYLLPPEILRFLMIRTPPRKAVNFSTDLDYMVKLFNDHDRLIEALRAGRATDIQKKTLRTIEVSQEYTAYRPVNFQLLTALLQLPHIDIEQEIERRTSGPRDEADRQNLRKRIASARYWLDNFATEEDRVELQMELPASVAGLTHSQRAFLHFMGEHFPAEPLTEDEYQRFIFDAARLTPVEQAAAFQAIYRALLDRDQGPKGGSLFFYLDKQFLICRFSEVAYSRDCFWQESSVSEVDGAAWMTAHRAQIEGVAFCFMVNVVKPSRQTPEQGRLRGKGVAEIRVKLAGGKEHMIRVLLRDIAGEDIDLAQELREIEGRGGELVKRLTSGLGLGSQQVADTKVTEEYGDAPLPISFAS
jgi:lysyl-tRNA synthetase, class I